MLDGPAGDAQPAVQHSSSVFGLVFPRFQRLQALCVGHVHAAICIDNAFASRIKACKIETQIERIHNEDQSDSCNDGNGFLDAQR